MNFFLVHQNPGTSMVQHKVAFCLLLSLSALLLESTDASPLMSVHGDAAGRRQRMSTSWCRFLSKLLSLLLTLSASRLVVETLSGIGWSLP
jgi:hypothetical protein